MLPVIMLVAVLGIAIYLTRRKGPEGIEAPTVKGKVPLANTVEAVARAIAAEPTEPTMMSGSIKGLAEFTAKMVAIPVEIRATGERGMLSNLRPTSGSISFPAPNKRWEHFYRVSRGGEIDPKYRVLRV